MLISKDETQHSCVCVCVCPRRYASTILRFQGAELSHVTIYLDAKNVPAAAYTAISRVRAADDFLLASKTPELDADHFVPAE